MRASSARPGRAWALEAQTGQAWPSLVGPGFLLLALLIGGASQQNAGLLGVLEIVAAVSLLHLALSPPDDGLPAQARLPLLILAVIVAIPLFQLIPLPPALWAHAGGRQGLAADMTLAGVGGVWRPLSLAPDLTLRSWLALLPPIAMFLLTLVMSPRSRRLVGLLLVGFAVVSVFLGAAQMAGGPTSALRFYPRTNADSAVGFFSNRNHFAVMLVLVMPFVAAAAVQMADGPLRRPAWIACAAIFLLLIIGVGVARSRAAVLLLLPALLGSVAIASTHRVDKRRPLAIAVGVLSVVGIIVIASVGLSGLVDRFTTSPEAELRWRTAPVIFQLGENYAPFGAGTGAFDPAFRAGEPLALLDPEYLNHAHDDALEIWLESGWIGLAALAAFVVWSVTAAARIWGRGSDRRDVLARATSLAVFLLLAASLVDYPLRTEAMATLFAFACGVMTVRGTEAGEAAPTRQGLPVKARF